MTNAIGMDPKAFTMAKETYNTHPELFEYITLMDVCEGYESAVRNGDENSFDDSIEIKCSTGDYEGAALFVANYLN